MDTHFYAFGTPLLLGTSSLICVCMGQLNREHRYLLWFAAFLALLSVGLTSQLLMSLEQRYQFVEFTTATYLLAVASLAQAMAQRLQQQVPWLGVGLLGAATMGAMSYYSRLDPHMPARLIVLSLGVGLVHLLVLQRLCRAPLEHWWDRATVGLYALITLALLCRPLVLLLDTHGMPAPLVSQHLSWGITSLGAMVLCSLLALSLCGSALADITLRLRNERDIDGLTGLLTRRAFHDRCGPIPYAHGYRILVFCDLDHFKRINDQHGHSMGDHVLREFGQLLRAHCRDTDVAARIGGEEFVLAFPHLRAAAVQEVVQRIQAQMQRMSWPGPQPMPPVTASFGMVLVQPRESLEHAMHRADVQLYGAKEAGRNCLMLDGMVSPAPTAPVPLV